MYILIWGYIVHKPPSLRSTNSLIGGAYNSRLKELILYAHENEVILMGRGVRACKA